MTEKQLIWRELDEAMAPDNARKFDGDNNYKKCLELKACIIGADDDGSPVFVLAAKSRRSAVNNLGLSIDWHTNDRAEAAGVDRYDAQVGILYVGTQDNGEGWWNWWIALAEQGPAAGDRAIVVAGGAPTLLGAQHQIAIECAKVARDILELAAEEAVRLRQMRTDLGL